jgi:hypothetical protein
MKSPSGRIAAHVLALLVVVAPGPALAQPAPPDARPPVAAQMLPQDQLDALLAPIALYPDQLLTQILMASTYPLEVVEAARFVQQNPGLKGNALDDALKTKNWDPSVQSLAAFPQVLTMMNDKLDWTQQLGDAFLANQQQVMDTVQSLRARARSAGNLRSTPQQRVIDEDSAIVIEPAQPDYVYVPVYNPLVIYGPWWAPAYRPWYWYPPSIYGYPAIGAFGVGIVWGSAWAISSNHWGWAHPAWRSHRINVDVGHNYFVNRPIYRERFQNGNWQHFPEHRRGVAYRDQLSRERFQTVDHRAVDARRDFRGNDFARTNAGRPEGFNNPQRSVQNVQRPVSPPTQSVQRPGSPPVQTFQRPIPNQSVQRATINRPTPSLERPMARSPPTINVRESRPQVQIQSNRGQMSRDVATRASPAGGHEGQGREHR